MKICVLHISDLHRDPANPIRNDVLLDSDLPLTDVAAAGGWLDVTTLLGCYQQPDEETLRAVLENQKGSRKALPDSRRSELG
jgi:hypothetical protein